MPGISSFLSKSLPAFQVYGANTEVGKSVFSTVLSLGIPKLSGNRVNYLKPVSTGNLEDADINHLKRYSPHTNVSCLFQYEHPVSPHLSVQIQNQKPPSDDAILDLISAKLKEYERQLTNPSEAQWALIETAGGVLSPSPSGTTQADMYRPLRLPAILVGDSKLGGISSTISAYESLRVRGYDVNLLLLFEDGDFQNSEYLRTYFESKQKDTPWKESVPEVISIKPPPKLSEIVENDHRNMKEYYQFASHTDEIKTAWEYLNHCHHDRIEKLTKMAAKANERIWYPFSQHTLINADNILPIDSAYGDFFQSVNSKNSLDILHPYFDASASWWTQGLGHGNPDIALSTSYAAGRYGHVMFAGTIHEPALKLADDIISLLDNPRLKRVFFSDNGSTGIEVALKMAFKAVDQRRNPLNASVDKDVGVIGLKRSYHGDTVGSMDACEKSVYNEQIHWYKSRGYWFEFPQVSMSKGKWRVTVPKELLDSGLEASENQEFSSLDEIYNVEKRNGAHYKKYIKKMLEKATKDGMRFGAVILEPILLGAGGMNAADPLFQKALVETVRENPQIFNTESGLQDEKNWSGLPVIFDEVFTGLYRLGHRSAAKLLRIDPDITVNAKLLTGGVLPLCLTIASESIFQTFLSAKKTDGLLHGHSYTAHPAGCTVAIQSLKTLQNLSQSPSSGWIDYRKDWESDENGVWSFWDKKAVESFSNNDKVEGVFTMGTVLAITLKDINGSGYASTASEDFKQYISSKSQHSESKLPFNMHIRGLGNVLYIMASLTSKAETLRQIEKVLLEYFQK